LNKFRHNIAFVLVILITFLPKVGDPLSDETDIGPVVNAKSLENMEKIVIKTLQEGADLLIGGQRTTDKGYFFSSTIFKNVLPNMEIAQEEIFGPIAAMGNYRRS